MKNHVYTYNTVSSDDTVQLGKKIGACLKKGDVIALQGTLGAGKTVLTKGIALALSIDENVTSPTFCLISEYSGTMPLYHFDVYRLEGGDDFDTLGADDMIYGDGVCVIEWSEKIMDRLPANTIIIKIEKTSDTCQNDESRNDANRSEESRNTTPQNDSRKITLENWQYGDIK